MLSIILSSRLKTVSHYSRIISDDPLFSRGQNNQNLSATFYFIPSKFKRACFGCCSELASTFDYETAKHMIGEKIPGSIQKVPCEAYSYTIPDSDETVTLDFTYQFVSEGSKFSSPVITNQLQSDAEVFSSNGQHLVEG